MLGKRQAQRGLLEADTMYADFVGRKTFYGFLAAQRDELFPDEAFAGLYNAKLGRPSVAPSLLATALVLQSYDRVSDDEAKQRADYDLRWKVALGVAVDSVPFAKSTLQEFRAQLILHEEEGVIFRQSLEQAKGQGYFRGKKKLRLALD
ncbi:MAG: transposase, partial [Acidimicrobiia bacterium]